MKCHIPIFLKRQFPQSAISYFLGKCYLKKKKKKKNICHLLKLLPGILSLCTNAGKILLNYHKTTFTNDILLFMAELVK